MLRYQSNVFEYRGETQALGPLNGTVSLAESLTINTSRRWIIKPVSAKISSRIPNIYQYETFNNTFIGVKRNVADPWTTIVLDTGIYTAEMIEAAITSCVPTWYASTSNPAIRMETNTTTDQIVIQLDSALLAPGGTQICLNLGLSSIYDTLGFPVGTIYIADGVYGSTENVNMDAQGVVCDVVLSLSNARVINGRTRKTLMSIPLTNLSLSEFVYPLWNEVVPSITYTGTSNISNYTIEFKTYKGVDMVFMDGSRCEIIFTLDMELDGPRNY